jgi:sugar phosphate isomerase/epimerase
MIRPAFSTVACPEWPLRRVAALAESCGALGVELRTFGSGSTSFACDPALTSPSKVSRTLRDAGLTACCVATSVRFDDPVTPPIVGRIFADTEKSVREAKFAIDLASEIGSPYVRVFGFEIASGLNARSIEPMIVDRLYKVADHARHRDVKIVLENGGSFSSASSIMGLIDRVGSPLLGAAYNAAVAERAGESATEGFGALGERLWLVKLKDFRGTMACSLGQGDMRCHEAVRTLMSIGYAGWVVYEYDRAWLSDRGAGEGGASSDDPSDTIRESIETLCRWSADGRVEQRRHVGSRAMSVTR